ncbi:hypothetical protein [Streptomyces sp. NPDC086023]|uniref:hypothetical protein n=1 Tax=Streptomyces sp. NPDC086023 TaxID=3365746 RepID=UPI0037D7A8CD
MLRSLEIAVELTDRPSTGPFHNVHWQKRVEVSLDCFICERTGRTTSLSYGEEPGVCTGNRRTAHPAPARISGFDVTQGRDTLALRLLVDRWWAPFHDAKRDQAGTALTNWVRLYAGYYCPESQQAGTFSIQSNAIRPRNIVCTHCTEPLATEVQSPAIRLLV